MNTLRVEWEPLPEGVPQPQWAKSTCMVPANHNRPATRVTVFEKNIDGSRAVSCEAGHLLNNGDCKFLSRRCPFFEDGNS